MTNLGWPAAKTAKLNIDIMKKKAKRVIVLRKSDLLGFRFALSLTVNH